MPHRQKSPWPLGQLLWREAPSLRPGHTRPGLVKENEERNLKGFYGCFVACLGLKKKKRLSSSHLESPLFQAQDVTTDTAAGRTKGFSMSHLPFSQPGPAHPGQPSLLCLPLFGSNQLCNQLEKKGPKEKTDFSVPPRGTAWPAQSFPAHIIWGVISFRAFTNPSVFNDLFKFSDFTD